MSTTSRETAVRATLKDRPAGAVYSLKREDGRYHAHGVFAALFNGATQGYLWPNGGAHFGKAEAEWGWPHAWEELMQAGLIVFSLGDGRVNWGITDKGLEVRRDYLAYHRELSDAIEQDEASAQGAVSVIWGRDTLSDELAERLLHSDSASEPAAPADKNEG